MAGADRDSDLGVADRAVAQAALVAGRAPVGAVEQTAAAAFGKPGKPKVAAEARERVWAVAQEAQAQAAGERAVAA